MAFFNKTYFTCVKGEYFSKIFLMGVVTRLLRLIMGACTHGSGVFNGCRPTTEKEDGNIS